MCWYMQSHLFFPESCHKSEVVVGYEMSELTCFFYSKNIHLFSEPLLNSLGGRKAAVLLQCCNASIVYWETVLELYWHPLPQEAREMGVLQGIHSQLIEKVNHISRRSRSTAAKSMDCLQDVQSS